VLAGWADIDIVAEIEMLVQAPTYLLHDVSAACLAELCFGVGKDIQNFFYIYVGSFVGGGLVLSNKLQTGAHGSAASIGSLPTGLSMDSGATGDKAAQLIERASLTGFEAMARAAGHDDPHAFYYGEQDTSTRALFSQWAVDAADSLAFAVTVTAAVLDLDAVVIAGGLPHDRVAELVALTHERLPRYNTKGLHLPQIHQAAIGIDARALGGAFAPIYTHFSLERNALLIEG
jgi:predicted NBD/HSP70 family sugar kinase